MNPIDFFAWLTHEQGLMAMVAQNWVLATVIIACVIFVETGVVIMPFLPGDSLLFTAGVFLGAAGLNPAIPLMAFIAAACLGDLVNFNIGRSRVGRALLQRRLVKTSYLEKAEAYFNRFGTVTIVVARFVPIVRTLAPFLAGVARMPARDFYRYNIVGAVLWCVAMVVGGYCLGNIPWVRHNLHVVSLVIILLSILPVAGRLLVRSTRPD